MTGATAILAAVVLIAGAGGDTIDVQSYADDTQFNVDALIDSVDESSGSNATGTSSSGTTYEYLRAPACVSNLSRMDRDPACSFDDPYVVLCIDGTPARYPIWRRQANSDGSWGGWEVARWYECPNDAILLAEIQREWSQLQPEPSVINLQPGNGWVIATVPTIAMAQDAPRLHATTLLGAGVEIRATASGYVWQWGDGARTETSDPGRPYPDATVTHTYAHASGDARVALTTTWTGEYRVNGGPWVNFDSTIESAAAPVTLAVHDPRSRLVDCDVTDRCRLVASG